MLNKLSNFLVGAAILSLIGGCTLTSTVSPTGSPQPNNTVTPSNQVVNPIIQALAPNPTAVAHKTDVMTFTVTAYAPDSSPLDYTWTATKGYLSSTKGQAVSWTPQKSDGTLETGLATVQVLLSNGKGGTTQGTVNILIAADGSASKQ